MLGWPNHPQATPAYIYFLVFCFFFFGWGHFGNKKAKCVELPQFESLGGLSVTLETLEVKVKMGG